MTTEYSCDLDDEHPLFLVNAQIVGLLEGDGASDDHEDVLAFLRATGLPEGTVRRMHRAIVHGDSKVMPESARGNFFFTSGAADPLSGTAEGRRFAIVEPPRDPNKARPCPFCGNEKVEYIFSGSQGVVICHVCSAEGPLVEEAADPQCDIGAAIQAWNKRVKD